VKCEHFSDFVHVKTKKKYCFGERKFTLQTIIFLMNFYNDYNQFRIDIIVKHSLFGGKVHNQ